MKDLQNGGVKITHKTSMKKPLLKNSVSLNISSERFKAMTAEKNDGFRPKNKNLKFDDNIDKP